MSIASHAGATALATTATLCLALSVPAHAQSSAPTPASSSAAPLTPAEQRARYSLPWTMRPGIAPTLVRLDSAWAFTNVGVSGATLLTGGGALVPATFGLYGRVAMVHQQPATGTAATALSNPLVFLLYTPQLATGLRLQVFAGVTLPVGAGGGEVPDPAVRRTVGSGIYTRSAMDNALFAVNYATPTAGLGLTYSNFGFTAQAEATVLQLVRVRGAALDRDEMRTNFTAALHVGYQLIRWLTASAEMHYQHWLSTPAAVAMNSTLRSQLSLELGLRANVPLSRTLLLRPGLSFGFGLNGAMWNDGYKVVHVDVPFAF